MSLKSLDDWNEQVVHVAVAPMHVAVLLLHPPEQPSHLEKRHKNTSGCSIVGQYKSMASPNHLSFCTNSFTEILLKGFLNDQLQWHKPTPVTWGVPWFEETAMLCWNLYTLTMCTKPFDFSCLRSFGFHCRSCIFHLFRQKTPEILQETQTGKLWWFKILRKL